jgi:hypothetical protein
LKWQLTEVTLKHDTILVLTTEMDTMAWAKIMIEPDNTLKLQQIKVLLLHKLPSEVCTGMGLA